MKRTIWHLGIGLLVGLTLVSPCLAAWTINPLNGTYSKTQTVMGAGDAVGNNSSGEFHFGKNNAMGAFTTENWLAVTFGIGVNGQTTWSCNLPAPAGNWSVSPLQIPTFTRLPDHFGQVYDDAGNVRATTSNMKSVITP